MKASLNKIDELSSTRRDFQDYLLAFFKSFSDSHLLMMHTLKNKPNKKLIKEAKRQHVVFLVRSLETYFRDLFVFCCNADQSFMESVLEKLNPSFSWQGFSKVQSGETKLHDLLAVSINFQNLKSINKAFAPIFKDGIINTICQQEFEFYLDDSGRQAKSSLADLYPSWKSSIDDLYDERHKIVHNANYENVFENETMEQIEGIILFLPQLISIQLSEQFNQSEFIIETNHTSKLPGSDVESKISVGPFVLTRNTLDKVDLDNLPEGDDLVYAFLKNDDGESYIKVFSTKFKK